MHTSAAAILNMVVGRSFLAQRINGEISNLVMIRGLGCARNMKGEDPKRRIQPRKA